MASQIQESMGLVIVAAGRGERAGTQCGPKQYRKLGTSTVIAEALNCFKGFIRNEHVAIAIHRDDEDLLADATKDVSTDGMHIVFGGATRQGPVHEGLKILKSTAPHLTHVMIHDAARPNVSDELIWRILETAGAHPDDGILPTIAVAESLKTVSGQMVTGTASRKDMHRAQTPQTFPIEQICALHDKAASQGIDDFTDDAALFEWQNLDVRIVEGTPENIKITYPQDFPAIMDNNMQLQDIRSGNGYDVHRFGEGDAVVLCGIRIPFDKGLSGHSDADVGLHALTDALLATCGAGDIGEHFPPSDPQWKGMASHIFLTHAVQIVQDNGGRILNADITLIAEEPKISPHKKAMRKKLSELLGIELQRCSVKATTSERMGFVGRKEGIAAFVTANVSYGVIQ